MRRTLLGLSQTDLADALGLTFQQVQKYEKAANRMGASRLFDLARILVVPVGWFFEGMSEAVAAAGPSAMRVATEDPEISQAGDSVSQRETLLLVQALERIPPESRGGLEAMIRSLATAE